MKTSSTSLVLAKLKEQGVITESEFLQMKQDFLKKCQHIILKDILKTTMTSIERVDKIKKFH